MIDNSFPDFFHFPRLFPDHFGIPWLFQVFQVNGHPAVIAISGLVLLFLNRKFRPVNTMLQQSPKVFLDISPELTKLNLKNDTRCCRHLKWTSRQTACQPLVLHVTHHFRAYSSYQTHQYEAHQNIVNSDYRTCSTRKETSSATAGDADVTARQASQCSSPAEDPMDWNSRQVSGLPVFNTIQTDNEWCSDCI